MLYFFNIFVFLRITTKGGAGKLSVVTAIVDNFSDEDIVQGSILGMFQSQVDQFPHNFDISHLSFEFFHTNYRVGLNRWV